MYTPVGGKAPSVPAWCIPVLPVGAPGSRPGSVVRCSCSCLPACGALYHALSPGLCGWHVGVALRCLAVRVVGAPWLAPWCRDAPSGVASWVRHNTSVPAGRSWRVCGSRVASLWSLACPWWGFGGKEYWAVSKPPSRCLTLLAFCGECVPRTILAGDMCLIPPSVPGRELSRRRCASVPATHVSLDSRLGS